MRKPTAAGARSVALSQKIPVHITYFTAWPDSSGKINYFNDIYERDEAMEKALGGAGIGSRGQFNAKTRAKLNIFGESPPQIKHFKCLLIIIIHSNCMQWMPQGGHILV